MKPFIHIITTRFNVPTKGWEKTKNGAITLSKEWMEHRFKIFEELVFPTYENQTNKNFVWLVLFDENTDKHYLKRIENLQKRFSLFQPLFVKEFSEVLPKIKNFIENNYTNNFHYIISSDIDNDDLLSIHYVETVQKNFNPIDDYVIDTINGLQMIEVKDNTFIFQKTKSISNPFVSLVEDSKDYQTVMKDKHLNYEKYANHNIVESTEPLHIQFIHRNNLLNTYGKNYATTDVNLAIFSLINKVKLSKTETEHYNKKVEQRRRKESRQYYFNKILKILKLK